MNLFEHMTVLSDAEIEKLRDATEEILESGGDCAAVMNRVGDRIEIKAPLSGGCRDSEVREAEE